MNKKRLVIYFFYDKDGIADRYVDYFLNGLRPVTNKFIIVSNGKITSDTREMFLKYSDDIIVRKNEGLDAWAYKTALEYVGWDELSSYYEVCLVNATIMGPVYPFEEMFLKMDTKSDLDFWGVNRYLKTNANPFNNPYGYLPEHIQSHFMVYRNRFLKTKELRRYWDNLPEIKGYEDSIGKHESYFTKFFADQGFKWTTYIHCEEEQEYNGYYLLYNPKAAIAKHRCPIFKRRSFFHNKDYLLQISMGEQTVELCNFLKSHTDYDVDMILENIIRTTNQYDLVNNLGLYYVLPSHFVRNNKNFSKRALVIMHIYYLDIIEESVEYARKIPGNIDICIITPRPDSLTVIKKAFENLNNVIDFRIMENRGRDVSALLVCAADIVFNYEYVCFYHDKKVTQVKPYGIGRSFAYKAAECALHSPEYIINILATFEENKRLGMLTNTAPYNGGYYDTIGCEWQTNFNNTLKVADELGLNCDLDCSKPPVAPLGTVFWFRTKAMKKLFDKKWKYEDFPEEPNAIDGTLLHAIERIYPYVVQDAGYYPAYVMPDVFAGIEMANYAYFTRQYNDLMQKYKIYGTNYEKRYYLENILSRSGNTLSVYIFEAKELLKKILKFVLPSRIYAVIVRMKRKLLN